MGMTQSMGYNHPKKSKKKHYIHAWQIELGDNYRIPGNYCRHQSAPSVKKRPSAGLTAPSRVRDNPGVVDLSYR